MKKTTLSILLIITAVAVFGQNKVKQAFSNAERGGEMKINLYDDGTFKIFVSEGTYSTHHDTIVLKDNNNDNDIFIVTQLSDGDSNDSIIIKTKDYNSYRKFAIGISDDPKVAPIFFPLETIINSKDREYKTKDIKLPKGKYLFLSLEQDDYQKNGNKTETQIYKLSPKTNQIGISASKKDFPAELLIIKDNKTKQYTFGTPSQPNATDLYLISDKKEKYPNEVPVFAKDLFEIHWEFENLYHERSISDESAMRVPDKFADSIIVKTYVPNIEESLESALISVRNYSNRYLWFINESDEYFDSEVAKYVKMKSESNDTQDPLDVPSDAIFYHLQPEDHNWLLEKSMPLEPKNLFLNASGNLIFQTDVELMKEALSRRYDREVFFNKMEKIAELSDIISTILDPSPDYERIAETFYQLIQSQTRFSDVSKFLIKSDENSHYKAETAIEYIEGKIVPPTIDIEAIDSRWIETINYLIYNNIFNSSFFVAVGCELNKVGYSNFMGNDENENRDKFKENEFKAFEYINKFAKQAIEEEISELMNFDFLGHSYELRRNNDKQFINSGVQNALATLTASADEFANPSEYKSYQNRVFKLTSEYIDLGISNIEIESAYFAMFINQENATELFEAYSKFLSRFDINNIFESMNNDYEKNADADYSSNWTGYKYLFANTMNNVAWTVVENKITDKGMRAKALQWSMMSTKIKKDVPEYLDTLAQLYYLNGDKKSALETEQKAIDLFEKSDGSVENIEKAKQVLKTMQSGNYR